MKAIAAAILILALGASGPDRPAGVEETGNASPSKNP